MEIVLVKHTRTGSTLHPCDGEVDGDLVVVNGVDTPPAIEDELQLGPTCRRIVDVVIDPDGHYVCRCA
jgi:hypothetical protein